MRIIKCYRVDLQYISPEGEMGRIDWVRSAGPLHCWDYGEESTGIKNHATREEAMAAAVKEGQDAIGTNPFGLFMDVKVIGFTIVVHEFGAT